jgi:hypothetical protein
VTEATGWEAFRVTTLDEGGDVWLWEILSDAENFFPEASAAERLAVAERLIRELCSDGSAYIAEGESGRPLAEEDVEQVIAGGRWRSFPPAPDDDERLMPTPKWEAWAARAREAGKRLAAD